MQKESLLTTKSKLLCNKQNNQSINQSMISLYCLPMQRNQYRSRMQSHSQNIGSGDSLSTPQKVQSGHLNNILPFMHSSPK